MNVLITKAEDPYQRYVEFRDARSADDNDTLLIVSFTYQQYWLDNQPIELAAVYWFSSEAIQFTVVQLQNSSLGIWEVLPDKIEPTLATWLAEHHACLFYLNEPLPLETVSIPKPWGQEIWYTGVEQRGVACFSSNKHNVPIPYLLEVMPEVLGQTENHSLILLKILDPLPEEIFGDLYFELHNEKQEVYVVTNIDPKAWPDGIGHMRMGFNPEKINEHDNEFSSEAKFRQQFLDQVLTYRKIRFQIDALLDEKREQQGYALNAEVPIKQLKQWLTEIPAELATEEKVHRQQMESYFGSLPLKAGDVVKVPLNVPHSLQHGVRTIEFQTPVYERRIISFAQKVLTQKNWDTEQGAREMQIVAPSLPELDVLSEKEGIRVEQVVEFSDFQVQRVTLQAPHTYQLSSNVYQLLIVLEGALIAGKQDLGPEQATLVPASPAETLIQTHNSQQVTFLVATPKS